MAAVPFVVSTGTRKFTWYPSTAPGYPTAASTSADFPFTVTSMGELTTARGLDGNGWPGGRLVRAGPTPEANREGVAAGAGGLDALTSEKSLEWTMAGPRAVVTTVGQDIGIT